MTYPPNALPYRERLRGYARIDGSPTVCVSRVGVIDLPGGGTHVFDLQDVYPLDADLTAAAVAAGATTWDEDLLCAELGLERAPIEPPAPIKEAQRVQEAWEAEHPTPPASDAELSA